MIHLPHYPVLVEEFLEFFHEMQIQFFFDGTVGFAGHAEAILKNHKEMKVLFACDKDKDALDYAKNKLKNWGEKLQFFHGDFVLLDQYLGENKVDGFIFDFGVSSMQLDRAERGFSFQREGPLDMRMNQDSFVTAEKIVNEFPEKKLSEIFKKYGEEKFHQRIAKAIVDARRKKRITTTLELVEVMQPIFAGKKRGKIHFATLVFQALRICVNKELEAIEKGIKKAISYLKPKGRIAVISFHSLEDRIVKYLFREEKSLKILTKKPVIAGWEEIKKNPRSRSAKLRVAEKICEEK